MVRQVFFIIDYLKGNKFVHSMLYDMSQVNLQTLLTLISIDYLIRIQLKKSCPTEYFVHLNFDRIIQI